MCKQERRQCEAGAWRRRWLVAHGLSAVQPDLRSQADAGRLSRHRSGDERSGRRPYRLSLRAGRQHGAGSIQGDKIRGIVVSANERLAAMPKVPAPRRPARRNTSSMSGARSMRRRARRRRLSPSLRTRSTRRSTIRQPRAKLANLGGTVPPKAERGPEHLRKTVALDIPRWAPILKEAAAATSTPN